jgi:Hemerythrin HHE cation binding domain
MAEDVVELIMNDHREVERLFEELKNSPEKRPNLLPVLTTLLTAHSRAEEAEMYPVARDEAGETEEVAHSQEEHLVARLAGAVLPGIRQQLSDGRRAELGEAFARSRAEHLDEQPGDKTLEQLRTQAANAGKTGTSGMSKDELADELKPGS